MAEDIEVLARVRRLLLAQRWIFARTMPENPHEYTLRREWESDADFVWVVEQIRAHGYDDIFQRRTYRALNIDGHKYWTRGAPVSKTILINRKPRLESGRK